MFEVSFFYVRVENDFKRMASLMIFALYWFSFH